MQPAKRNRRMPSPRPPADIDPDITASAGRIGGLLVMGLLLMGLTAATVAVAFQRGQTERCLAFYGPQAAAAVSRSGHVELWRLAEVDGRLTAVERVEISAAKGLVHLRRGLVEDANFDWKAAASAESPLPLGAWDWAIVFDGATPGGRSGQATQVVIDLGDDGIGGWISVVGQGGRIGLGRLGPGLATWIGATVAR
jgi:hypothetical protein